LAGLRLWRRVLPWTLALAALLVLGRLWVLPGLGRVLVEDRPPVRADAVVVLATGSEFYPRLMEAARLVREGFAPRLVINGNRKTEALRRLEALGYEPAAPWYENPLRILELLGVERDRVTAVSVEDAYDTISECRGLAPTLQREGIGRVLLVTSRFHTRRASAVWRAVHGDSLEVVTVAARQDPFDPDGWWRHGRQIRWVLAEYGGWLFYLRHRLARG
jgi:uncharacterized SAM-binding protein YcdF (DUF218 family)